MGYRGFRIGLFLLTAVTLTARVDAAVTQYTGAVGNAAVGPAFGSATLTHFKQYVDFDGDGLTSQTAISPYHYLAQGISLTNLDAVSPFDPSWTHSPPMGAWHSGFGDPITTPHSVTFTSPVATLGCSPTTWKTR